MVIAQTEAASGRMESNEDNFIAGGRGGRKRRWRRVQERMQRGASGNARRAAVTDAQTGGAAMVGAGKRA